MENVDNHKQWMIHVEALFLSPNQIWLFIM